MAKSKDGPDKKVFSVRINEELIKQVKHLAIDEGKQLNTIVEEALISLLENYKKKNSQ